MSSHPDLGKLLKDVGVSGLGSTEIQAIFKRALVNGGALAELFFEETHSTRVIYEGGRLDRVLDGVDRGVGLRILFENRSVYGYTTDLTAESIGALADTLASAVKKSGQVPAIVSDWRVPPRLDQGEKHSVIRDPRKASLVDKIALVKRAEAAARAKAPQARQVTGILLDTLRKILIVNHEGSAAPQTKTYLQMVVQVVAERGGRVETAHESDGGFVGMEFFDQVTPESLGAEAARRAMLLLDAKPAPSGTMPVVISADAGGTMIHEAVGHGLEADLACNGLSVYQGKVGQQVASPLVTVVDDGTIPNKRGSYSYDDEGTPARKNVLIENGVLKGYLVDRISAMKFDLMATGNGRRETFRQRPIVRMTNTYIAPGKDDPAQILADTKYGVFVKAMGGGQVNTVTGDFVFAVTEGYLIRDGKLAEPIRGATLVGNGPQVLIGVDRVGTDLGFSTGTCGKDGQGAPVTDAQPTLRIPALTVGGEVPLTDYWKVS